MEIYNYDLRGKINYCSDDNEGKINLRWRAVDDEGWTTAGEEARCRLLLLMKRKLSVVDDGKERRSLSASRCWWRLKRKLEAVSCWGDRRRCWWKGSRDCEHWWLDSRVKTGVRKEKEWRLDHDRDRFYGDRRRRFCGCRCPVG